MLRQFALTLFSGLAFFLAAAGLSSSRSSTTDRSVAPLQSETSHSAAARSGYIVASS